MIPLAGRRDRFHNRTVTLSFDRSPPATHVSYQLLIRIGRPIRLRIGALGVQEFPAGHYLYTGSARRNLEARIHRHLRREKKLRWHID